VDNSLDHELILVTIELGNSPTPFWLRWTRASERVLRSGRFCFPKLVCSLQPVRRKGNTMKTLTQIAVVVVLFTLFGYISVGIADDSVMEGNILVDLNEVSENIDIDDESICYVNDDLFFEQEQFKSKSCSWQGATRYNRQLTESKGYRYRGSNGEYHYAIYFTVYADANCYDKDLDWWVSHVSPTHGHINGWLLMLYSNNNYWNGNNWVKDVVLLVPTSWWYYYWPMSNSWKADRFILRWNRDRVSGCCD